ncbi:MAG TPA: Yip1 family protein, partial [Vicinamibacterales bacterium]|nr:Yip1 family protein [Vicinamibacterales bacterium]
RLRNRTQRTTKGFVPFVVFSCTEANPMTDLKTRVVNILTKPSDEWPRIAAETTDSTTLTTGYIAPLAAITPAATFVGISIIGISTFLGTTFRVGIVHGVATAVVQFLLAIAGVHVAAIVVDKLAPQFKSQPSSIQALKLVAYASTAAWVAGIANVLPQLGPLGFLAGLYSIYLMYLGMTPMMKTPDDQVFPYMVVSAVAVIGLMLVAVALAGTLTAAF